MPGFAPRSSELARVNALQTLLFQRLTDSKDPLPAVLLPRYVHAFCELSEVRRVLRDKPLPGEKLRAATMGLRGDYLASANKIRRIRDVQELPSVSEAATYGGVAEQVTEQTPQLTQADDAQSPAG